MYHLFLPRHKGSPRGVEILSPGHSVQSAFCADAEQPRYLGGLWKKFTRCSEQYPKQPFLNGWFQLDDDSKSLHWEMVGNGVPGWSWWWFQIISFVPTPKIGEMG